MGQEKGGKFVNSGDNSLREGGKVLNLLLKPNTPMNTIMPTCPAYSFTFASIAKALVAAHERGVKVEIILDKSHLTAQYTSAPFVAKAGIPVKIDSAHDIPHNKIMIIDGEIVITGSFNFTKSAEDKNAENLLIIRDKALAEKYIKNWQEHAAHSEGYMGR
jgi:phosphatidylserine/phosphatidylglycerophosphate/cardiolipin synthase-like enzyme